MGRTRVGGTKCCLGCLENEHPVGNTQEVTGHAVRARGWAVGAMGGWMVPEGEKGTVSKIG